MSMIALSGTFKARESCDRTTSMIALSGTFKARRSCDQAKSVIALSGTFKAVFDYFLFGFCRVGGS